MDLRRFQLLLNDACLFDGNLLSTGFCTDLFRYELLLFFLLVFGMRSFKIKANVLHGYLYRERKSYLNSGTDGGGDDKCAKFDPSRHPAAISVTFSLCSQQCLHVAPDPCCVLPAC